MEEVLIFFDFTAFSIQYQTTLLLFAYHFVNMTTFESVVVD